jgi:hypothetical protein
MVDCPFLEVNALPLVVAIAIFLLSSIPNLRKPLLSACNNILETIEDKSKGC